MRELRLVTWIDSEGVDGWTQVDSIGHDLKEVATIGWVIFETEDVLTLSGSVDATGSIRQCHAPISIPKVAIQRDEVITFK